MAGTAQLGNFKTPLVALGGTSRRHPERMHVVTIVADRVRLARLILVRQRVERRVVRGDIVRHDLHPTVIAKYLALSRALLQRGVAGHAIRWIDALGFLVIGDGIGNFAMAFDAVHAGVDAFGERIGLNRQQGARLVVRSGNIEIAMFAVVA